MIAFILQEGEAAVGLTVQEFADMTALELLASGPIAINSATYVGFIKAGFPGAIIATAGVCIPGFILTAVLYAFLRKNKENKYVQGFISAITIACGGILLTASITMAQSILLHSDSLPDILDSPFLYIEWAGLLIAIVCCIAIKIFKVNPIVMLFVSAFLGVLLL